jgi:hypothetical protein
VPRGGQTRITVSEDHTMTIAATAGVGSVLAGTAVMLMGTTGPAELYLPALGIVGVGIVFFLRRSAKARREKLKALLDRLTRHVVATTQPQLPDAEGNPR